MEGCEGEIAIAQMKIAIWILKIVIGCYIILIEQLIAIFIACMFMWLYEWRKYGEFKD